MAERAGYLPGLDADALQWEAHNYGPREASLLVLLPVLKGEQITTVTQYVRSQACARLKTLPVGQIVDAIDLAVARLLDRQDPYRRKMDDLLPVITGYDREMVRLGLTGYLKTFRKPELQRFLAEDFTNPSILDDFQPLAKGGFGRAFGPDVLGHIWAGNVPGLPLWSLAAGYFPHRSLPQLPAIQWLPKPAAALPGLRGRGRRRWRRRPSTPVWRRRQGLGRKPASSFASGCV